MHLPVAGRHSADQPRRLELGDTRPDVADGVGHDSRAVLEVRSHEVPFVLADGQRVVKLIYERLVARPDGYMAIATVHVEDEATVDAHISFGWYGLAMS